MAHITRDYCFGCDDTVEMINGQCPICQERQRREALAAWKAKTTDEKLLDLHKRLLDVERRPSTTRY